MAVLRLEIGWQFASRLVLNSTDGVYSNGSIYVYGIGDYSVEGDVAISILDKADLNQPTIYGQCRIDVGSERSLASICPGVDLVGKYIYVTQDANERHFIPILKAVSACYWDTSATCAVSKTLSNEIVFLSWSGAKPGTGNAISKYEIQRCESSDGKTWGSWVNVGTVSTPGADVHIPSTPGNYYKFRVRIQGAAGASYYSGWKESTNTVRRDHAPLEGFTDATLTAGASPVKALHMTELHDRVNTLRTFYGLSAYVFSPIDDRGIAGWTDHVNEIKEAIEGVCTASGKTHEAWIAFSVNCPRADVILQLRAVVLAL